MAWGHLRRRLHMLRPHRHADSAVAEAELGTRFPPWRPTFRFRGPFLDPFHASLAVAGADGLIDLGIEGWLRPADALKLYELAVFSPGDLLELGTYHGLSTHIQGHAMAASDPRLRLTSLELDPELAAVARTQLVQPGRHDVVVGDARESGARLVAAGRRFGLAFVDHSHEGALVAVACEQLKRLVVPGGFALFHDYNDVRNGREPGYGVFGAVRDAFADRSFAFWGCYGCTGLFRRARG